VNRENLANWVLLVSLVAAWLPMMPFVPGTRPFAFATSITGVILAGTAGWAFVTQRVKRPQAREFRYLLVKALVGAFGAGMVVWGIAQGVSLPG
jgi:VIT1/CCC1 family predicted Fe2+/Mn2+ transporter